MPEPGERMEAEIREQPDAFAAAVASAERTGLRRPPAVVLFARGTSDNAALYGRYLLEAVAGIPVMLGAPSLASLYDAPTQLGGWLAIGVSQSGETREIADSLRWAGARGARTLAVTNAEGSPLAGAAEECLVLDSGPELAVAATKTFTAECAALAALAYGWSDRRPGWDGIRAALEVEAAAPASEALGDVLHPDRLALVLGRGFHLPLAQELALKIMESCGVWATGMSWADLLHGPIAAVPRDAACLVLAGGERLGRSAHDLEARLAGIGVAHCTLGTAGALDAIDPPLRPLVEAVPAQLAILAAARRFGLDPDAPAGLTKVTQT